MVNYENKFTFQWKRKTHHYRWRGFAAYTLRRMPASATRALDVDLRALGVDSCDVHSNLALECIGNSKIYHSLCM